ncbi:hypothetical protein SUGI_0371040 [Cryptomeria japonica]|uniref:VQ motif-containing protein 18-like n=1 Tax=Cryptomeria japonica TaxID=3369 RepID=UPI002408DF21|nr:VQ motif-containing protein 18-like [Cryptomeria japonica]GLJ20424.1 hypothetical protein SUGI_0371040 [Cryptomeria japonica]
MKQMKMDKNSASSMLGTSKSSHTISKSGCSEGASRFSQQKNNSSPPLIRVVHVYEPEIIKTDPENFRSLVQKLTGKSTEEKEESEICEENSKICTEICEENHKNPSFGGFSQGLNNLGMLFPGLIHRGSVTEIPLVKNTSPFCNSYDRSDGCRLAETEHE